MSDAREITWTGEERRPLQVARPCECGCDERTGLLKGVGYLTGSDPQGKGFTLWIEDEEVYGRLKQMLIRSNAISILTDRANGIRRKLLRDNVFITPEELSDILGALEYAAGELSADANEGWCLTDAERTEHRDLAERYGEIAKALVDRRERLVDLEGEAAA